MAKHPNPNETPKSRIFKSDLLWPLGLSCFVIPLCPGFLDLKLPLAFISPGSFEFLLIMLALILLFGAKDAPRIFRTIQTLLDKAQRAAASFRYKIMYGDLHSNPAQDEPYDVEADYPSDEEDEKNSELEPENPEQKKTNSEPKTEN